MELYLPVILDGATGTQLQKLGFTGGMCTEEWVLKNPETIQKIQADYIKNGSNIVYSPTFGGNRVKLEENGHFNKTADFNKRLAALSEEVAAGKAYVAGDIAPTGKFLAPVGDTSFEELVDIYTEQAKALEEAGVDLFVIETMMTVPEARAAILAVKSVSKKPVLVSFTCNAQGRTLTGTDVVAALLIFQGMGADAFGLNCSVGPEDMLAQLKRLSKYAEVPLIAKPNAGMPEVEDGKTVYRCTPEEFRRYVPEFAACGVGYFGGCCGTTEDHIKAIAETLKGLEIKKPAPDFGGMLPLATEKNPAFVPADLEIAPESVLACDAALGEALEDECDKESPVTAIRITAAEELDEFADHQFEIDKPLCLVCEDAALLEEALKLYQGRAMYEGNLPEEVLKEMSRKYGLVW